MAPIKKNVLFLVMAFLLMCGVSFAERGNVARARRELNVGDRPTKAPVHSPTHKPTDEEKPTYGDDDDGSGKGKGRPTGDDDDGSGKGKGGSGMVPDDDAFYMSYPEGKGKGARPSSKKSSKKEKSSKSDKSGMYIKFAAALERVIVPTISLT